MDLNYESPWVARGFIRFNGFEFYGSGINHKTLKVNSA